MYFCAAAHLLPFLQSQSFLGILPSASKYGQIAHRQFFLDYLPSSNPFLLVHWSPTGLVNRDIGKCLGELLELWSMSQLLCPLFCLECIIDITEGFGIVQLYIGNALARQLHYTLGDLGICQYVRGTCEITAALLLQA